MRLSSFFKYPSSWSKGAAARNKVGQPVNLNALPFIPFSNNKFEFESLSLAGAVSHFYSQEKGFEGRAQVLDRLRRAISKYTGKNYFVEEFNNLLDTKFEDIRAVIKIADL